MHDWELEAARDAMADQTLTEVCTIIRTSRTGDGYGGVAGTETVVASGVACRVHTEPVIGRYVQGIEGTVPLFLISLPWGQDVDEQDVLSVGDIDFTVMRVLEPETWSLVMTVECSTGTVH